MAGTKNMTKPAKATAMQAKQEDDAPPPRLQQHVRASIENEIIEGKMLPGGRLDEQEIAQRFGCSQTPAESETKRPPIPTESGHPIRTKAATLLMG